MKITLDTNAIIDLEEQSGYAQALRCLIVANELGKIMLRVTGISASERPPDSAYISPLDEFKYRLQRDRLHSAEILKPICYTNVTFSNWCITGGGALSELEKEIHDILFPRIEFSYFDYCRFRGLQHRTVPIDSKWRNAKCDVLAIWCHIYYDADIFVNRDFNFFKQSRRGPLIHLVAREIMKLDQVIGSIQSYLL